MAYPFMVDATVVAKALNIGVTTVYNLAVRDSLPIKAYKLGRSVRFKRNELEAYLEVDSLEEVLEVTV